MKNIFLFILIAATLSGCKTWVGRQYTNTVARYNKIYHSQKIIRETDQQIKAGYQDDFNKTLTLINLGNESSLKGNGGNMDNVVKKTSRIIEKHPRSKWTDDAWFLLGQSYFYRGDFFAAIENFEYVSAKYKKTEIAYKANLWELYTYILMQKESESLAIISKLQGEKKFPEKYRKGLNICAAEIAIRQNKPLVAANYIKDALPFVKNKNEKIRYSYVLAQLYQSQDSFEQASNYFNKVIKLNPPYDFNFNAQINLASALASTGSRNYKKAQNVLKRMLKDDKNLDYYSKIYFELGRVSDQAKETKAAIDYYNLALRSSGSSSIINTDAYTALGNIYFNKSQYLSAKQYFDSANMSLDEAHPRYEKLAKKMENLSKSLGHLVTLQQNDSLLKLANNPALLEETIDLMIAAEKAKQKLLTLQEEAKKNSAAPAMNSNLFNNPNNLNPSAAPSTANASFPFYDMSQRGRGVNDFRQTWGDRKLEDNWRVAAMASGENTLDTVVSNKSKEETNNPEETVNEENIKTPVNIADDRKKYYEEIPYTENQKYKLNQENQEALLQLGVIHIYDYLEVIKGKEYLNKLIARYANAKQNERAFYELAKASKSIEDMAAYDNYFLQLNAQYPESKYVKALKNELIADNEATKNGISEGIKVLYESAVNAFHDKDYLAVLKNKHQHDSLFGGSPLQSNFDYLAALTSAKKGQLESYKIQLETIIEDYPSTKIGEQAQANLEALNRNISEKELSQANDSNSQDNANSNGFVTNLKEEHYSILVFEGKTDTKSIQNTLADYHKVAYSLKQVEITELFVKNKKVMIVKGFNTIKDNKDYLNVLKPNRVIDNELILNSSLLNKTNLQKLVASQSIEEYIIFANKVYK